MTKKGYERFGKYLILDHLVDGGMAKICRARYLGEQANKMVAVKMVQPQFSNDEAFVRMFQDELNITFGMLHPNIMQVYDYGKVSGQLYTAMEYIHGANLKQFLDRLKEKKVVFPVEISCHIISQVCLGLHYAHTFTDKLTGKPYNVVHRDISPHNIMLTYDGAVKVIDFGIAKANTNSEATQAGTIKGKLTYLAPEYLEGLELDARYDEFAVGITLWEMLCSRKLFQANNDLATLKLIQACKITPPSQINPLVPKELDQIIMKALSKDRNSRFENLDQLNRALVKFLYSQYPNFNPSDLKTFADNLFKEEIVKDQEKFVAWGKMDITPFIEDLKREESRTGKIKKGDFTASGQTLGPRTKVREIELELDDKKTEIKVETVPGESTGSHKLGKTLAQSGKIQSKNLNSSSPGATNQVRHTGIIKNKKEQKKQSGGFSKLLVVAASVFGLIYLSSDKLKILFFKPEITRNPTSVEAKKIELPGTITLRGTDISMEIYVNGEKVQFGLPIKVQFNKEVNVEVKKKGYVSFSEKVVLDQEKKFKVIQIPELKKLRAGLLTSSKNFAAGSKFIYEVDGEVLEKDLPFSDLQIPEGVYQSKVINPILGTERRVEVVIEENKKHFLE